MKKSIAVLITLTALLAFSGCTDVKTGSVSDKQTLSTETLKDASDKTEEKEEKAEQNQTTEKSLPQEQESPEQETTEVSVEETTENIPEQETSEGQEQNLQEDVENENTPSDDSIQQMGNQLFENACKTTWNYLCGCPYELDYEDSHENAFRVTGDYSLDEIRAEYGAVFNDCSLLDEKYIENNGVLYCYDGGRGENIYYQSTELRLVSSDDSKAVFNAVSHYADPETNEPMEDEQHDFVIVNTENGWRVSGFTIPY